MNKHNRHNNKQVLKAQPERRMRAMVLQETTAIPLTAISKKSIQTIRTKSQKRAGFVPALFYLLNLC